MSQISMKQRFKMEDKGVIRTSWEDDKDQTEIHLKKKEKR